MLLWTEFITDFLILLRSNCYYLALIFFLLFKERGEVIKMLLVFLYWINTNFSCIEKSVNQLLICPYLSSNGSRFRFFFSYLLCVNFFANFQSNVVILVDAGENWLLYVRSPEGHILLQSLKFFFFPIELKLFFSAFWTPRTMKLQ